MEGFVSTFPLYNSCGTPALAAFSQGGGWGKREGRFMTPQGLNYLELCRAILAQVSPGAAPYLRRAHTKDCGVQVNAKLDKIIQCSLGPKTLFSQEGDRFPPAKSAKSPDMMAAHGAPALNTPPVSHLRALRTVSIYSPVFDRRSFLKKLGKECESEGRNEQPESDKDADPDQCTENQDPVTDLDTSDLRSANGSNFQFLEQRYAFFHCKKCNIRWESAYVWCISGTSKVYYKQLCRKCQVGFNPYRVESILCKGCLQTCCCCEKKQRHINMKRPHRQDLCCRCKGMKLSCDATYSFKYIV
ncbi:protein ZAR1-like [Genypterus blacodes]|uniref:protein ZAR1-like n=1 Tax=Genypterus blacodes TaxID=154954 RepID=UPI003F7771F0